MNNIKYHESLYYDEDIKCHGFIAYPTNHPSKAPCVLVAHDWTGRDEKSCHKAMQLAEMGYTGFAIDMYGGARLGKDKEEKKALIHPFRENRNKLVSRMLAAYQHICKLPGVHPQKIAAIGYCFGGLCVLDLARAGANLQGVVSFHGLLSSDAMFDNKDISAKILVLHGYDDPLAPPQQVLDFSDEMTQKQVDWQLHMYGLTAHSFTNPLANDNEMGLHYNPSADKRSWESTELFLREVLAD